MSMTDIQPLLTFVKRLLWPMSQASLLTSYVVYQSPSPSVPGWYTHVNIACVTHSIIQSLTNETAAIKLN